MSRWTDTALPPVPRRLQGQPHSVSWATDPSALLAPAYAWADVKDEPVVPETEPNTLENIDPLYEAVTAILPKFLQLGTGSTAAVLNCGTVVVAEAGAAPIPFAGFVTGDEPQGEVYRVPVHRLPNKATLRAYLASAQARLDAMGPADRQVAQSAFAALAMIGYPYPGTPDSVANVVRLARNPATRKLMALIQCASFARAPARYHAFGTVLVRDANFAYENLLELANMGRDTFRYDLFTPVVARIWRCP